MTQPTIYSPHGEREGLIGGIDLAQRAAGLAVEAAAAVTIGIAKEIGGVLLGRELSDAPQRSFTLQDGETHSRGMAVATAMKNFLR